MKDLATLLDVIVGYDPDDPITALGEDWPKGSFTPSLDPAGLSGARIGVMTQPMGFQSEPDSADFRLVSEVFGRAIVDLEEAGAHLVELPEIPGLNDTLAKRTADDKSSEMFDLYFGRSAQRPYESLDAMMRSPDYARVHQQGQSGTLPYSRDAYLDFLLARDDLLLTVMKLMVDNKIDAIVHKTVEHQPTLISEGLGPPHYDMRGTTHLNTFLVYVPSISVPAGFTSDGLPVGITFLGKPYLDDYMVKLAYAYEQATGHRRPPALAPSLPGEP